jgi:hypothetical protein
MATLVYKISRTRLMTGGIGTTVAGLEADPFPQPVIPGFELAPLRQPGEQHAGGLEQVGLVGVFSKL